MICLVSERWTSKETEMNKKQRIEAAKKEIERVMWEVGEVDGRCLRNEISRKFDLTTDDVSRVLKDLGYYHI